MISFSSFVKNFRLKMKDDQEVIDRRSEGMEVEDQDLRSQSFQTSSQADRFYSVDEDSQSSSIYNPDFPLPPPSSSIRSRLSFSSLYPQDPAFLYHLDQDHEPEDFHDFNPLHADTLEHHLQLLSTLIGPSRLSSLVDLCSLQYHHHQRPNSSPKPIIPHDHQSHHQISQSHPTQSTSASQPISSSKPILNSKRHPILAWIARSAGLSPPKISSPHPLLHPTPSLNPLRSPPLVPRSPYSTSNFKSGPLIEFRLFGISLRHINPASYITVFIGQPISIPIIIFNTTMEIYRRGIIIPNLFFFSPSSSLTPWLLLS